MIFLLISILAHVLSDFVFQSDNMVKEKSNSELSVCLKANCLHVLCVFGTSCVMLILFYNPLVVIVFSVLESSVHFIIDFFRYNLKALNSNNKRKLYGFIIDQVLHLLTIFALWVVIPISRNPYTYSFVNNVPMKVKIICLYFNKKMIRNILIYLIIYIFICFGGAVIIEEVLNILKLSPDIMQKCDNKKDKIIKKSTETMNQVKVRTTKNIVFKIFSYMIPINSYVDTVVSEYQQNDNCSKQEKSNNSAGKYIGIFERLIIITLVLKSQYSAIAFVFTAKSLARSNDILKKDKNFGEYFLVGTLLSTTLSIIGGIILKFLVE